MHAARSDEPDLSSGLAPDQDRLVTRRPDAPAWAENLLFSCYDPASRFGVWVHLGTVPDDGEVWEDRVLIVLPDDGGVLSLWSYARNGGSDSAGGGANVTATCVEPFRRWRISVDGRFLQTSHEDMAARPVSDGPKVPVRLDLDVVCRTPVWDAHAEPAGADAMAAQSWASEHLEQLLTATGTLVLPDTEVRIEATGWRDHSRGPRGATMGSAWGGHMIAGGLLPDGRGIGASRYWTTEGQTTLAGGYVVEEGVLRHAVATQVPTLTSLQRAGERLSLVLDGPEGQIDLVLTTVTSAWLTLSRGLPYGVRAVGGQALVYALSFCEAQWDGELFPLYLERSATLSLDTELLENR